MSKYTPDVEDVRRAYRYRALHLWNDDGPDRGEEFDRFIARIKAEAWDEGYDSRKRQAAQNPPMGVPGHVASKNPYRTEGLNSEDKS